MSSAPAPSDEGEPVDQPDASEEVFADSAPDAGQPMPVLPPPAFCTACGEPLQPDWVGCPKCIFGRRSLQVHYLPSRRERAGPTIGRALALYFLLLAASAVGIIFALNGEWSDRVDFGVTIAHTTIVLIFAAAFRQEIIGLLGVFPPLRWYPIAACFGMATFLLAHAATELVTTVFALEETEYLWSYLDAGYGWWTVILLVCVQPAVVEELAFRGVVYGALGRVLNISETIIVSSMLFMALHLSIPSAPHLFVIGLALGYLRYRTGSLYPCMVMHFVHNLLVILSENMGV